MQTPCPFQMHAMALFGAIIEFSLNDFLWIQWIMTKSKSSMVTRDIVYLTVDTLLDIVVISNFPLLSVGWYLFRVLSGNRYLTRGSNKNTLCITSTGNVSVARRVIHLIAILLLDLVMIHWIHWIQRESFRENSNNRPPTNEESKGWFLTVCHFNMGRMFKLWSAGFDRVSYREKLVLQQKQNGVSPKWNRTFIEFSEFSEFKKSGKLLKHELGSI